MLLGHLVEGVSEIQAICDEVGVDEELKLMLSHMILSHHDLPEFGSPKPPMFPEAEILHEIDLMDARMYEMNHALRSAQPELMRSAQKGIVHKNTASRKVSRLSARIRALGA